MSNVSFLAFPATRVLHRGQARLFVEQQPAGHAASRVVQRYEMITVTVASRDALLARRALLVCPATSITRCLPVHREDKVKLEIRFPAGQAATVMDRMLACLPNGEIGGVIACAAHGKNKASARPPTEAAHS